MMRTSGMLLMIIPALACAGAAPDAEADRFNYLLGTQAIGGRYQFTADTRLVESAKRIASLGSNLIKFTLSREGSFGPENGNVPEQPAAVKTLTDLATLEPSHKAVLDMPFTYYLMWVYPFTSRTQAAGFKPEDHERQYHEMFDFASHLLRAYNGSGKQFHLGHWEGDWHLRPHFDPKQPFPGGAAARLTEWLRVRQRAVEDARRATPHRDVAVWHYTEVNLVQPFLQGGSCLTNDILPQVDIDFVSYSCYDSIQKDIRAGLFAALDHIESKLRPRADIPGKRVFLGEYGFPTRRYTPEEQNRMTLEAMLAGIEWGCPFTLYWELYCNELREGQFGGFWLIDNRDVKQPVWFTHERYFQWARAHVEDAVRRTGAAPAGQDFRRAAAAYLRSELERTANPPGRSSGKARSPTAVP